MSVIMVHFTKQTFEISKLRVLCLLLTLLANQNREALAWNLQPLSGGKTSKLSRVSPSQRIRRVSFSHSRPMPSSFPRRKQQLSAQSDDEEDAMKRGEGASRIIPMAQSGKSQLAAAFTALDESDQYDAVLTGLCAKILDGQQEGPVNLDDPASLLREMNERSIQASPRSLMALVDVSRLELNYLCIRAKEIEEY